jgi:hypothetical protein
MNTSWMKRARECCADHGGAPEAGGAEAHRQGAAGVWRNAFILIDECNRQSENCAYSATTFIIWLRVLRVIRLFCVVTPILFGAIAAWKVMADSPAWAATCILLATAIPPAYHASGADKAITDYQTLAGEMTNLRDRFRHAANIDSHKSFAEFGATTKPLLDRLEKARARSLTPPEWCFRRARKKHKAGHCTHDYDQSGSTA